MEQIEEAGIHSGDSACVLPAVSLADGVLEAIEDAAARLASALGAIGLLNLQMAVKGRDLYVIEANPRASRTIPFVSKAIGIPVAKLAARTLVGDRLREMLRSYCPFPTRSGTCNRTMLESAGALLPTPWPSFSSVKEVVLPFDRFPGTDVLRGPEMRSTGEVMSFGATFAEAFATAQTAAGDPLPTGGTVLVSLADRDKRDGVPLVAQLSDWGFSIVATRNTARSLRALGLPVEEIAKVGHGRPDVVDRITGGGISLVICTPTGGLVRGLLADPEERTSGFRMRIAALESHIPFMTNVLTLRAAVAAIRAQRNGQPPVRDLREWTSSEGAA
jgi:carbamoyl-phosphate synthase large subunit